jgi:hypothetical protein
MIMPTHPGIELTPALAAKLPRRKVPRMPAAGRMTAAVSPAKPRRNGNQRARERYQLYKARTLGQRPTSSQRLRELQRAYEQAEARLRFAEAEERRARDGGEDQHDPN